MDFKDVEIFDGLTLSQLFKEAHGETKVKRQQISEVITLLTPFIGDTASATMIAPIIRDYLDVAVKNDDQLVKIATVVQRLVQTEKKIANDDSGLLTPEEKKELLKNYRSELEDIRAGVTTVQPIPNEAKSIIKGK